MSFLTAYGLAPRALQGKQSSDGFGFPFDRPLLNFTEHLLELEQRMPSPLELSKNDEVNNLQYLNRLYRAATEVAEDPEIRSLVKDMQWRSETFDSLRKAMPIALPGGVDGFNDEGNSRMHTI